MLTIYQIATRETWWGDYSAERWAHIERFEDPGARKRFEEYALIKHACLGVIEKATRLPVSGPILARVREEMKSEMESYDPLTHDSAFQIADYKAYGETVGLGDRLVK